MFNIMKKMYLFIPLLVVAIVLAAPVGYAQEDPPDEPAFANPAQAAKAEALAEAAAEVSAQAVADAEQAAEDAQDAVDVAQEAYDAAVGTPEEGARLADLETAQANLTTANDAVTDTIADAASIDEDSIASMRAEDMGWGEIALELGVHPSTLGLGHRMQHRARSSMAGLGNKHVAAYGKTKQKTKQKTQRNVKSGVAKTPGVAGGKGSKAVGLSRASDKAKSGAKGAKSSKDSSASGGRGNSGNSNAGGNGKSNAGGKGKGGGKGNGNGGGKGNNK